MGSDHRLPEIKIDQAIGKALIIAEQYQRNEREMRLFEMLDVTLKKWPLLVSGFCLVFLYSLTIPAAGTIPFMFFPLSSNKKLAITTSPQTLATTWACSGLTTVQTQNSDGTPYSVPSTLTVTLTAFPNVEYYSNASCTTRISSVNVTTGTSSRNFYFRAYSTSGITIGASATNYDGVTQDQTVTASIPFTWLGTTDSNWSTGSNWTGGTAPGSADTAYFDGSCTNCTVNTPSAADLSLNGLRIAPSFSGTINQNAARSLTVSGNGWSQAGGSFLGSAASLTLSGGVRIYGGTFRLSSASTTVTGNYNTSAVSGSTPTILPNGGSLTFAQSGSAVWTFGSESYDGVTLWASNPGNSIVGNLTVNGKLYLSSFCCSTSISGGTITANGDIEGGWQGMGSNNTGGTTVLIVAGSGNQTLTGVNGSPNINNLVINKPSGTVTYSGSFAIFRDYTVQSGTVNPGSSTISFWGSGGSRTFTFGSESYNNVYFNLEATRTVTLVGTLRVNGFLEGNGGCCAFAVVNGGSIRAFGDVRHGFVNGRITGGGTASASMEGASAANLGLASVQIDSLPSTNFTINKSGAVTMLANVTHNYNASDTLTLTSGSTLNMNNFDLTLMNLSLPSGATINRGTGVLKVGGSTIGACNPCSAYGGGVIN